MDIVSSIAVSEAANPNSKYSREELAFKFMCALLSNSSEDPVSFEVISKSCFLMAEAFIEVRDNTADKTEINGK